MQRLPRFLVNGATGNTDRIGANLPAFFGEGDEIEFPLRLHPVNEHALRELMELRESDRYLAAGEGFEDLADGFVFYIGRDMRCEASRVGSGWLLAVEYRADNEAGIFRCELRANETDAEMSADTILRALSGYIAEMAKKWVRVGRVVPSRRGEA